MQTPNRDKTLFIAAACWNWLAAAGYVLAGNPARAHFGLPPSNDPLSAQLFAALVALFGLGYYYVSRDTAKNRAIVKLGIIGKMLVFLIFVYHAATGNIPWTFVIPTLGDVVFAVLFLLFLRRTAGSQGKG